MLITKKKLLKYIEEIEKGDRADVMGACYEQPISERQQEKNLYLTGYEHGSANVCNALKAKFKLRSKGGGDGWK